MHVDLGDFQYLTASVERDTGVEQVAMMISQGGLDFEYMATYSVGVLPSGIKAGDFNSDGVPDMVVSNQLSNNIGLILSDP